MSNLSFKISRPKPMKWVMDSDSDTEPKDQLLSGFDSRGATHKNPGPKKAGPLIIPSQPNKDWKEEAAKLRAKKAMYLPDGALRAMADSKSNKRPDSKDVINNTVVVGGLQILAKNVELTSENGEEEPMEEKPEEQVVVELTEEQRAVQELLAGDKEKQVALEAIVSAPDGRNFPQDDTSAFKESVASLPDQPTNEDYSRVPIGLFGEAMLRGMGWKGPTGKEKVLVPKPRPAFLGIGAKAMDPELAGIGKNAPKRKDQMKYVPVMQVSREGSVRAIEDSRSRRDSPADEKPRRERSRSPSYRSGDRERSDRRDRDRERDRDRDRNRDRDRGDRDHKDSRKRDDRELRRRDDKDRDRRSSRRDDTDRDRDRDRHSSRRDDKDRDTDRHKR